MAFSDDDFDKLELKMLYHFANERGVSPCIIIPTIYKSSPGKGNLEYYRFNCWDWPYN